MRPTTAELAAAVERVCRALRGLPLDALPPIASLQAACVYDEPLRINLQLAADGTATARSLLAWADAIPRSSASACWGKTYLRWEVSGVLAEEHVSVWDHLHGRAMPRVAKRLGMATVVGSRDAVLVPITELRRLAADSEESRDE
jgi:hypothetical protein